MPTSKWGISFDSLQVRLFKKAAGLKGKSISTKDATVGMELAERANDSVANVDIFATDDTRGRG